ncbi:MAG TPA: ROK family protein, partial [Candidatus Acidoferrales bacterium]
RMSASRAKRKRRSRGRGPFTLAIDVGGTGLKASVLDARGRMVTGRVRMDTPYPCPPEVMVDALAKLVEPLPRFDRVSVGFPGVVRDVHIITAPHFGNDIWHGFDLAAELGDRLGKPVRVLNDADMQGLAAIHGHGLELVITLGTGVGSALFRDGELMPHLELAHHPVWKKKTYNQYIGEAARKKIGNKKWNRRVASALDILRTLFNFDQLHIGGGNAKRLKIKLPAGTRTVSNQRGILGGIALWAPPDKKR